MPALEQIYGELPRFIPVIVISLIVVVALRLIKWLWLEKQLNTFSDHKIVPQLLMILFGMIGGILIILSLPVSDALRGQILSLLGLVVTGVMALSSATFVSNAFAGSMLRLTRSFRIGDFIRVGDQQGRVSDRGIFHTEIQTEDRDLITFPNLYLITNPVTVVRTSGTIISATVSLGYDLAHARIETLLIEAATKSGLEDPYVHLTDLGDFSISYKVCGFLREIKTLITARSNLKKSILDTLHADRVEIVSPAFVNQRPQKEGSVFIPAGSNLVHPSQAPEERKAEDIVFDKAEEAEAEAFNPAAEEILEEKSKGRNKDLQS